MPIRLVVRHGSEKHRFVGAAKVEVFHQTGPPLVRAAGSTTGRHVVDIPADEGDAVEVHLDIDEVDATGTLMNLLKIRQILEAKKLPGGGMTLVPHPKAKRGGNLHPRLSGRLVGTGAGRHFEVTIDLTFLDVTDFVRKNAPTGGGRVTIRTYDGAPSLFSTVPHYGGRLRLLEYTDGKPVAWAVLLPPAITPTIDKIHTLLYFRPVGPRYKDTDDVDFNSLVRFLADPLRSNPFYTQPSPGDWSPWPLCGWERQVCEAGKPVILVNPLPHGPDHGDAPTAKLPGLLDSLVRALWGDGTVGANKNSGVTRGSLLASGFSFGGGAAFQALGANRAAIDQLFLFDPNGFAKQVGLVSRWFGEKAGRRLRMGAGFGTTHRAMLDLEKQLASANATVEPKTPDFWFKSPLFRKAVERVDFSPTGFTPPPGSFSEATRIFFVSTAKSDTAVVVEGRDAKGKSLGRLTLDDCTRVEAATMLDVLIRHPSIPRNEKPPLQPATSPVSTAAELAHDVSLIVNYMKWIRHQWPVVGGTDASGATDRGAGFKGILQLFLEASGL